MSYPLIVLIISAVIMFAVIFTFWLLARPWPSDEHRRRGNRDRNS